MPRPSVLARVRASAWAVIALRVAAVAIALLVLAWIGRTAAANPTATGSGGLSDRAAAPIAPAEGADAGPPPTAATAPPPSAPPAPQVVPSAARAHASPADPVFINHASVEELRRLPGVGPKRAAAILVLRQRLGHFQRVEDLLRVKGVGRGAVKKWRPLVRLDTPTATSETDGGLR